MNEEIFWTMIESSWLQSDKSRYFRDLAFVGQLEDTHDFYAVQKTFIHNLTTALDQLPATDLLSFDRILELKLYDIDRADIQYYTDGSDDGFLYCRSFIVSMGQTYYEAVRADPSRAVADVELEELCYLPLDLYKDKFGAFPYSDISRETGSNQQGWAGN